MNKNKNDDLLLIIGLILFSSIFIVSFCICLCELIKYA
jgi:hypothetical protein